jgi:hypothetical protein
MTDPAPLFALAAAGTAGIGLVSGAGLRMWQGWLELKRSERRPGTRRGGFDLAELKARVRKLEAIADGADLHPGR